ncbi:putative HAUS augmin-like complex subunit 2 [Rosa chinensis]|uniref:Putative HAUS augmin-like complex subunit 2 n=1 Tax=Rosa chinensis TaxID=74649 RepID=A0A2P6S1Y8_ROSCH|nr:putative HAUS augmin-like complex subunit 2 [Rosa chinensis]
MHKSVSHTANSHSDTASPITPAKDSRRVPGALSRITTILKDVIQNKDRIIACLQQPYSLDCIPVEAEYQKQFSELLMKAASDYGALTASEMLRPIPVALASCTRFFEAISAMRESFATLQHLRVGHSDTASPITPAKESRRVPGVSDCVTPPPWKTEPSFDDLAIKSSRRPDIKH